MTAAPEIRRARRALRNPSAESSYRPPRRAVGKVEHNPRSWGACTARLRDHLHWLLVCGDCGKHQPARHA